MLLESVGADAGPASGGRQMPSHWSSPQLHIVSPRPPSALQFLPALGCADACRRLADIENGAAEEGTAKDAPADAIVLTATGEGATSEGEFWESIKVACLERVPLLYLVEDNGWAISVPVEKQTMSAATSPAWWKASPASKYSNATGPISSRPITP